MRRVHVLFAGAVAVAGAAVLVGNRSATPAEVQGAPLDPAATDRADRADRPARRDRALCTAEGNCYWNVFLMPAAGASECPRYAGTFEGGALETLTSKGDENMADVRGYWNLHGGRLLLQSYRFVHGGYRLVDALLCKRSGDDRLDCADSEH